MSPAERTSYLEDLIRNNCHDLNSHLGVILGWASSPKPNITQGECVECRTEIQASAQHMAKLIRELAKAGLPLLITIVFCGQTHPPLPVGAPVPKELVSQMKKQVAVQASTGFTLAEIQEFRKLHDTDTTLWRLVIAGNTRLESLEHLFALSDQGINTRMITQHEDRIGLLEKWQKTSDETRTIWENRMWSATQAIIVIIAGMALAGAGSMAARIWAKLKLDPDRRSAATLAADRKADERAAELIGHLETVKEEVVQAKVVAITTKELVASKVSAVGGQDWKDLKR